MSRFVALDELSKGRDFDQEIVVLCVRWYLSFKLSYRDLVCRMNERGILSGAYDHLAVGAALHTGVRQTVAALGAPEPRSPAGIGLIPQLIRMFKLRDAAGSGLVHCSGQDQDFPGGPRLGAPRDQRSRFVNVLHGPGVDVHLRR
jgi:hypothetical protein